MDYKTFNYKNYRDCYFYVENYLYNKQAMAITIVNENEGNIVVCTVNMTDYLYEPNTATIKNYSINAGMTKFLKKLGIIEEVYSKVKCNQFASEDETIDYCAINITKLKEYTKYFNYEWSI